MLAYSTLAVACSFIAKQSAILSCGVKNCHFENESARSYHNTYVPEPSGLLEDWRRLVTASIEIPSIYIYTYMYVFKRGQAYESYTEMK